MEQGKNKSNTSLFMDDLKLYRGNQPDIDSLIQTMCTVADDDIGKRFRNDKWLVLAIRRVKETEFEGITIGSRK